MYFQERLKLCHGTGLIHHYKIFVRTICSETLSNRLSVSVMRKIETFVNEDKLYILWRTKVTNFRKVMKLSQITVLKLRTIFLNLCQNNLSKL